MNEIVKYDIIPDYAGGFKHAWTVSPALADAMPWDFVVEEAQGPDGPWTPVSPEIVGAYTWTEPGMRRINKNPVLYFRVVMTTPKATYTSPVRMPYGDLGRREFLIARDMMRREVLHMRTLAGVPARVWLVSTFGPRCTACVNPITGSKRDSNCKVCLGTGRNPPYQGPFDIWATFTPAQRTTQMAGDGTGTREPAQFSIRMIGSPPLKKNDVVVDPAQGKRYYVDAVQSTAEIRRVPVIQTLTANEAPVTDIVYRLTE